MATLRFRTPNVFTLGRERSATPEEALEALQALGPSAGKIEARRVANQSVNRIVPAIRSFIEDGQMADALSVTELLLEGLRRQRAALDSKPKQALKEAVEAIEAKVRAEKSGAELLGLEKMFTRWNKDLRGL